MHKLKLSKKSYSQNRQFPTAIPDCPIHYSPLKRGVSVKLGIKLLYQILNSNYRKERGKLIKKCPGQNRQFPTVIPDCPNSLYSSITWHFYKIKTKCCNF